MSNKTITVTGKGGVGKTSISANIIKALVATKPNARILAIDADPAVGLATALNVDVKYTLDDIRKEIVSAGDGDKSKQRAIELLGESKFRMIDAIVECEGFSFIAIGRPETAGCYCSINMYLKDVISSLSEQFDYVVIDGEAGIEQVNRRVMETVSHLIFVTDQSQKGMNVVKTIKKVADELVMYKKCGIIINRVIDESMLKYLDSGDIEILTTVKQDNTLLEMDARGQNVFDVSSESPIAQGVRIALDKLEI